jgi:hypothetical protein
MLLTEWAKRWGIPLHAIEELRTFICNQVPADELGISEAAISNRVRLEASKRGCRLWRNNVGAATMEDGSFVRYGLANDSAKVNAVIKSADLIGIRPLLIEPWMVGHTVGQFVSREIKKSNWRYTGNDREKAQMSWALLVLSFGGDAAFATSEGTL